MKIPNRKEWGSILFGAATLIISVLFSMNHFFIPRTEAEAATISLSNRIDKNAEIEDKHHEQDMNEIHTIYQYILNKK